MTYRPYPNAAADAVDVLRVEAVAFERAAVGSVPHAAANCLAVAEEIRRAADWLEQHPDEDEGQAAETPRFVVDTLDAIADEIVANHAEPWRAATRIYDRHIAPLYDRLQS